MKYLLKINNGLVAESIIAFLIKVYGAGMSFIFSIIIGNCFVVGGVGLYYLAISILNLTLIIAKMGFENALIKYISVLYAGKYGISVKRVTKNSAQISASIAIALLTFIFIFSEEISMNIFNKPELTNILRIIICSLLPSVISAILISMLKGINHVKIALVFESAVVPTLNVFMIFLFFFLMRNDYTVIAYVYLISCVLQCLILCLICIVYISRLNDKIDNTFKFKSVMDTAKHLLLVNSTNYLLSSTDTLMLGVWKNEEDVGVYNISSKITMLPTMILAAINAIFGPRFSVLSSQGKFYDLQIILRKICNVMSVVAALIAGMFIFFAAYILALFGPSYIGAESIVIVVSVGQLFLLATGPVATLLMMTGNEKYHRNNAMMCALLNMALNLIFIPYFGSFGAALATSISIIAKNIIAVIIVYKKLGMKIY